MMMMIVIAAAIATLCVCRAEDVYVSAVNGSDVAGNGSQSSPYQSISGALDKAQVRWSCVSVCVCVCLCVSVCVSVFECVLLCDCSQCVQSSRDVLID